MTGNAWAQIGLFLALILLLAKPLGAYMARVYSGDAPRFTGPLRYLETAILRICRTRSDEEISWKQYAVVMLLFNGAGILLLYALQRFQHLLPFNPRGFPAVGPDSSLNTAISFVTNTNWQGYAGRPR